MDYMTELSLAARIDALGESATPAQAEALISWVVENVAPCEWMSVAESAILVPGVYTELSMRCGECGF